MSIQFKKATKEDIHAITGLAGGTGSGKTYTAMMIAKALSKGKRFGFIDSEARRGLHYADEFDFEHLDLDPPFTPDRYLEAILAAEKAGFEACVVDSMTHEHTGDGGILDWQEKELQRLAGDDYEKRKKMTPRSWVAPKTSHKKMLSRLLQLRMHLILCFRAENKNKYSKDERGKLVITDAEWQIVCAKGLEFEMTASVMLNPDKPGTVLKRFKVHHKLADAFAVGKQLGEQTGVAIAEWSSSKGAHEVTTTLSLPTAKPLGDHVAAFRLEVKDRTAGDIGAAIDLVKELCGKAYLTNKGWSKDMGPGDAQAGLAKLKEHPIFGDNAKEEK